jgi:hypothetical protein
LIQNEVLVVRLPPVSAFALVSATLLWPACERSSQPPRQYVTMHRQIGSWQGTGDRTIGDVMSESGRLRVRWETRGDGSSDKGTFRLTARSAVSGRLLQVVADHRGDGQGATDVEDDRRTYDFTIESANLTWSVTVEDVIVVDAGERSPTP